MRVAAGDRNEDGRLDVIYSTSKKPWQPAAVMERRSRLHVSRAREAPSRLTTKHFVHGAVSPDQERNRMKFASLVVYAVLAVPACNGSETSASFDGSPVERIARKAVADGRTAGVAVGVVRGGKLVFNGAYGRANLEHDVALAHDSVFSIFSITKAFTAAAIMQLSERGMLRLDDPLTKYFPQFPNGDKVKITDLLSHTSGIADYARPGSALERMGASSEELVGVIEKQQPLYLFPPGTKWNYSNSNYALLGRIIEKVSGRSYRDQMAAIFASAGMTNTAIDRNSDVVPKRASGYMLAGNKPGTFMNGIFVEMSSVYAAGAMRSTVADLAAGFHALFTGRIVDGQSVATMMKPARLRDGRLAGDVVHGMENRPGAFGHYASGLDTNKVCGHPAFGAGGAFPSFNSIVRFYPDKDLMLIVLTNTGMAANQVEHEIARNLLGCPQ
jgi:D-alanyl-D-alanine carboxypeptidase